MLASTEVITVHRQQHRSQVSCSPEKCLPQAVRHSGQEESTGVQSEAAAHVSTLWAQEFDDRCGPGSSARTSLHSILWVQKALASLRPWALK